MQPDSAKLRVGLLVPSFDKGGLESVVFMLYRALRDQGHEATVLAERGSGGFFSGLVEPADFVNLQGQDIQLFAEIAARRLNVMHYNYSVFMLSEVHRMGLGVIYTLHNVYTWLSDFDFASRAALIGECDAAVAVSSFAADYFKTRSGRLIKNLSIVPNGISVEELMVGDPVARAELNIPEGAYVFAQFSSFHRVKHHLVLIKAAERLLSKHDNFRIVLFGNLGDEAYYREIRAAVTASPARDMILMPGFVKSTAVGATLRGVVDCALLTTLQEGCGNAALEAAALGIPLIMTDTGIARDLQAAGSDIDIVPAAANVSDLTYDGIEALSRDGQTPNLDAIVAAMSAKLNGERAKFGIRPFKFVQSEMVMRYAEIYQSIVKLA